MKTSEAFSDETKEVVATLVKGFADHINSWVKAEVSGEHDWPTQPEFDEFLANELQGLAEKWGATKKMNGRQEEEEERPRKKVAKLVPTTGL